MKWLGYSLFPFEGEILLVNLALPGGTPMDLAQLGSTPVDLERPLQVCSGARVLPLPPTSVVAGAVSLPPGLISIVRSDGFGCWLESLPCLGR